MHWETHTRAVPSLGDPFGGDLFNEQHHHSHQQAVDQFTLPPPRLSPDAPPLTQAHTSSSKSSTSVSASQPQQEKRSADIEQGPSMGSSTKRPKVLTSTTRRSVRERKQANLGLPTVPVEAKGDPKKRYVVLPSSVLSLNALSRPGWEYGVLVAKKAIIGLEK
jgi:hypothetical protein